MADKKRLGSVPSGLSWLTSVEEPVVPAKTEQKKVIEKTETIKVKTITVSKTSEKGLQEGWTRATFILKKEYLEKLKDLAYWDRVTVKYLLNESLKTFLKDKRTRKRKV